MLHLIVDGYNIIRAQPNQWNLNTAQLKVAREKLIKLLNDYLGNREDKITVVFDAHKKEKEIDNYFNSKLKIGKVNVIYTQRGEEADEVIKRLVLHESELSNIIVATSDKGIIEFVRGYNVKVISARTFYNKINPKKEELTHSDYFEKYIKGYSEDKPLIKCKKLKKRERRGPKLW